MKYREFTFTFTSSLDPDILRDVWASELGEAGFEGFEETAGGLRGYIPAHLYDPAKLNEAIQAFPLEGVTVCFSEKEMEDKDWNEEWENNYFKPVEISGECIIHASFHQVAPGYAYDILINPKMAFGTGNHETTFLMMNELLSLDIPRKAVLDMGCGTGLLAILAAMKGASPVVAVDVDEWACRNALENILLNRTPAVSVIQGGAEQLPAAGMFDIVLANISRNVLLNDLPRYALCMNPGATLYMSGFYTEDIPLIRRESLRCGLTFLSSSEKNRWAIARVRKTVG
jgi:ribosomal protein L11 methyltransferase